MMSIRSLADFNGPPLGGAVTGWHRHRHRPGPTLRVDTTKEGWGLLPGHQRGPTPGHQRGLSHGHGHPLQPVLHAAQPAAPEQPVFNSFHYTTDPLLPVVNFKQRDAFVAEVWAAWASF